MILSMGATRSINVDIVNRDREVKNPEPMPTGHNEETDGPTILVIDRFSYPADYIIPASDYIGVELETTGESFNAIPIPFSHGDRVAAYIKAGIPNANILTCDTAVHMNPDNEYAESVLTGRDIGVNECLKIAAGMAEKGTIDAINMSKQPADGLSGIYGRDLNPTNIDELREEILLNIQNDFHLIYGDSVEKINPITAQDVHFYLSAGNDANSTFNFYSLADPSPYFHVVAATDDRGNVEPYSNDNDLVTDYAQGTYEVMFYSDENQSGFDITEDGIVDLLYVPVDEEEKTRLLSYNGSYVPITGTSFAAPTELVENYDDGVFN